MLFRSVIVTLLLLIEQPHNKIILFRDMDNQEEDFLVIHALDDDFEQSSRTVVSDGKDLM